MQLDLYAYTIECLIAILRKNAYMYMHEQITKEFEMRKYLYECTPFGYINLRNRRNYTGSLVANDKAFTLTVSELTLLKQ